MKFLLSALLALWPSVLLADRVLSIGGSVTEIVFALGQDHRLVGRDRTSTFPPDATALPDVGYMRALSPEGVLSVAPDLILSEAGAGPVETIEVLTAAGVDFVEIPDGFDVAAIAAKITAIGDALGVPERARALVSDVEKGFADLGALEGPAKRVMFILSLRGGRVMVAGQNTAADGIIDLAGGLNAAQGFEGYKPLSDEAIVEAAPDVILMMDRRGDHAVADQDLWALPALATTPAAASGAVVRMDGLLLLGFGPRTPEAVAALQRAFEAL